MSVLSPALLGAVGLVLVASSVSHLRSPGTLRQGLRAHGVLTGTPRRLVPWVLGPLEAVLGAAALVCAVTDVPATLTLAVSMPIAGLFLLLTGYLWQVLRVTAGQVVPCACGLGDAPVSPSAVLRGGILAVLAVAGGVTSDGWSLATAPAAEVFVALAAMIVLALSAALLPAARAVPDSAIRAAAHPQNPYENPGRTSETPIFLGGGDR